MYSLYKVIYDYLKNENQLTYCIKHKDENCFFLDVREQFRDVEGMFKTHMEIVDSKATAVQTV